tara:strand:+ start:1019 stop:1156 length:138 start_codon:yes stop_codon:yes gene_type:complete
VALRKSLFVFLGTLTAGNPGAFVHETQKNTQILLIHKKTGIIQKK